MEKFAVIFLPDDSERITKSHPLLKHLPKKYAQLCLQYIPAQVTGIIMDTEENVELGYMLDVPGFFMDWDKLTKDERDKHIKGIIKKLNDLDVYLLCFPLVYEYFYEDEIAYLKSQNIIVMDGFYHRLASLLLVLKQLLYITRNDLPFYEVGIWGADTEIGRVWVEVLAGQVNSMCIGGHNTKILNILADMILKTTGLSCQVTTSIENCLNNKQITVVAELIEENYSKCQPSFHFLSYREIPHDNQSAVSDLGIYTIDMGWMDLLQNLSVGHELNTWEELGVLEGLFYTISKVYREDILMSRITLKQMERLHALYGLYPLKVPGFIQNGRKINFDRFRMDYFRKRRHNQHSTLDSSNNTP